MDEQSKALLWLNGQTIEADALAAKSAHIWQPRLKDAKKWAWVGGFSWGAAIVGLAWILWARLH